MNRILSILAAGARAGALQHVPTGMNREFLGAPVTLRQLLRLDQVATVPTDWPDQTYDYFWIVDFASGNPVPVSFRKLRQEFTAPFDGLPANAWAEPEPDHMKTGCRD